MRAAAPQEILVHREQGRWVARTASQVFPCAIGRGGVTAAKREGDGATPLGSFSLRGLFFRPDKGLVPRCGLPLWPLRPDSGWCDDALAAAYNRSIRLPRAVSAERLWRHDALYDLVIPLGYNDGRPRAGAGSAIFLHPARPGLTGTEGCVALRRDDLLALLPSLGPEWRLTVEAQ